MPVIVRIDPAILDDFMLQNYLAGANLCAPAHLIAAPAAPLTGLYSKAQAFNNILLARMGNQRDAGFFCLQISGCNTL